ncbi:MAG: type II secretion system F family protein, partial [Cyanobacteria bacterium]|nr:type II secretion system F family protein [Cyanobacteriota bacterium]
MNPMALTIIGLFALGAILFAVALYFLQSYFFPGLTPMQERLNEIKKSQEELTKDSNKVLGSGASRLLKGSQYENENLGKFLERYSFTGNLQKLLRQAGMKTAVDKYILTFLIIPSGLFFLLFLITKNLIILLLGPGVFLVAVFMAKMRRQGRFNRITNQLPDALNLITSSLRAGHSFQSAMGIVVAELPPPISLEFGQVVSDLNWGLPVKEALYKMLSNLEGLNDIRMFVTCLVVQRETGGNLAEILDKLSYTIRERFKLHGQIKALTGQSTLTGYVLGSAPIVLFTGLYIFMNGYIKPMLDSDIGKIALGVAAVMQVVGFIIMRKIIQI